MVSAMQRDTVKAQISAAVAAGAKVLFESPTPSGLGNWQPVTVIGGLDQSMGIQRVEVNVPSPPCLVTLPCGISSVHPHS